MKKYRTAVYPGSFDPITNGHLDILERASELFDHIIIAVIENPQKQPFFSTRGRISLIKKTLKELQIKVIKVDSFDGLLVNYLAAIDSRIVIRGLRAVSDFDYEFQMALMNRKLMKEELETVFLMTDARFAYLSSSLVKEISLGGGDVSTLVPECVFNEIRKKYKAGNRKTG